MSSDAPQREPAPEELGAYAGDAQPENDTTRKKIWTDTIAMLVCVG